MKIADFMPMEDWLAFQAEIDNRFNTGTVVYDAEGMQATPHDCKRNPLCQAIRSRPEGQTQICARAQQAMATMTRRTREAAIEECDAGMVKLVVPVFSAGEFLGTSGICGLLRHDDEVDAFYVGKVTGISEAEIAALAKGLRRVTRVEIEAIAEFMAGSIEETARQRAP